MFFSAVLGDERMIIDQGPLRWKWVLVGSELYLLTSDRETAGDGARCSRLGHGLEREETRGG